MQDDENATAPRPTLDGYCAAAHLVGAAVLYDPDGSGFVFYECNEDEGEP